MLLVYVLIFIVVMLLVFSLSRETGKNTKHARKGVNAETANVKSATTHSAIKMCNFREAS
jgi:hypothetical protein